MISSKNSQLKPEKKKRIVSASFSLIVILIVLQSIPNAGAQEFIARDLVIDLGDGLET